MKISGSLFGRIRFHGAPCISIMRLEQKGADRKRTDLISMLALARVKIISSMTSSSFSLCTVFMIIK
jgi:hypothetical protein